MSIFPVNATNRLFVDYFANGHAHTLLLRYPGAAGVPGSTFLETVDELLIESNQWMPSDYAWLGSRVSLAGSTVSNPFPFTPTAFSGANSTVPARAPQFVSFVGRSVNGIRARATFLGSSQNFEGGGTPYANYRLTSSEVAFIAAAVAILDGMGGCSVDGAAINWKPYANLGYSSYWQKAVRS